MAKSNTTVFYDLAQQGRVYMKKDEKGVILLVDKDGDVIHCTSINVQQAVDAVTTVNATILVSGWWENKGNKE